MKNIFYLTCLLIVVYSCKNDKKVQSNSNDNLVEKTYSGNDSLTSMLTLDKSFQINDVRRYGVVPGKGIGTHPKTGNNKMDELMKLAGEGIELIFPEGIYKTSLDLSKRRDISLVFDKASFTGSILLNGSADNKIKNIALKGSISTYGSFSSKHVDKVKIDSLIIKSNENISLSKSKGAGCNIYTGTISLYIDYLEIEGTGSDSERYKYVPAALRIHGKSPAPNDILIKHAEIISSDRHGAYLSGKFIEIEKLNVQSFAQGKIENMIPIAYTVNGDEKKITGVWVNDFEDSTIGELKINTQTSPRATDAIYLDSGDVLLPSVIAKPDLKGSKIKIRKAKGTNVEISE